MFHADYYKNLYFSTGSVVADIKPKAKYRFRTDTMLFGFHENRININCITYDRKVVTVLMSKLRRSSDGLLVGFRKLSTYAELPLSASYSY
jgi:hypothetical protein